MASPDLVLFGKHERPVSDQVCAQVSNTFQQSFFYYVQPHRYTVWVVPANKVEYEKAETEND